MYFADSDMLQRHLHNDLNTLIRNIKVREEDHLKILDYNRAVAIKQRDIEDTIFINDQLTKHKNFLSKFQSSHQILTQEEKQILNKYSFVSPNIYNQAVFKLMSRVGARILQLFQSTVQKIKNFPEDFEQNHRKMKNSLLKTLNQKQKINISELLSTVITYIHEKTNEQLEKLKKIIAVLEQGQIEQLNFIYERKSSKKPNQPIKKKEDVKDYSLDVKKQKQKVKDRLTQLREQAKKNQKVKRQKNKLAQRMVTGLYSTMDIHKNQFMEDMVCTNPHEKYRKLYDQIYSRNRVNKQQITAFEAKTQLFHEKVKKFKERMLAESAKIQQAVIIRGAQRSLIDINDKKNDDLPNPQGQRVCLSERQIPTQDIVLPEVEVLACKFTEQRPLRTSIQKAQSPRIVKQTVQFYSMHSAQQVSHQLKFDSKQEQVYLRTNRARLPQIGRNSVDGNTTICKKSLAKEENKINIATSVNINGQTQKQKTTQGSSNKKDKPNFEVSKEKEKKKQSLPKSFQYTFYIKKRTNRFYETRNHFVV